MSLRVNQRVEFGLGTIGIGKPWGFANPEVPDERQTLTLLERAFALGVRYFDTAPSYGVSEERLGRYLAALTSGERSQVRITTKFGEHWDMAKAEPFVDHSFDALRRSLDGSLARLGRIDFLQLHKTTPQVLGSRDLARAWEYAATLGITAIGASVSDLASAEIAIANPAYRILQFPYNVAQQTFADVLDRAAARGMKIAVNRPFGMGRMLYENRELSKANAFGFILEKHFEGVILSGTKSPDHLEDNWRAFEEALVHPQAAEEKTFGLRMNTDKHG
jgi:aryl-alcohol dehydrogenase-like predicted oxidoreductase